MTNIVAKWSDGTATTFHNVVLGTFDHVGGRYNGGSDQYWVFECKEGAIRIPFRNVRYIKAYEASE